MQQNHSDIWYWIGQITGLLIAGLGIVTLPSSPLSGGGFILLGGIVYVVSSDPSGRVSLIRRLIHAGKAGVVVLQTIPGINLLFEWRDRFDKEVEQESAANSIIDDFEEVVRNDLGMSFDWSQVSTDREDLVETISNEAEIFKRDVYPIIADHVFSDVPEDERRIRLILALCREHERADGRRLDTGEAVYALKSAITRELADLGCDFEEPNDAATRLLTAYANTYKGIHTGTPAGRDLFTEDIDRSYLELWQEFRESFLPFEEQAALDDQLLSTIIDVVDRGELDQAAVAGDVDELIQREREQVREDLQNRDAYLVLSLGGIFKRGSDLRDKLEQKYHNHIAFGKRYNTSDVADIPDPKYVTFHIVFPEKRFPSTDAFLDDVLRLIPADALEENAFVTVYRLEATNPEFEPPKEILEEELPAYFKSNLDVVEFLETGSGSRTVTKTAINNLLGRKMRVRDLLAAVPLNVFADATPQQEQFINAKYNDLKERFQISELYDWCDYTKEHIASVLCEWDEDGYASEEEWEEIAEQMIEGAEQCRAAATSN